MNIAVLNGSPKGNISVTMQYVAFIQKKFPQHSFDIINISKEIKKLNDDKIFFENTLKKIANYDGILWAFPLYVFMVPYQLKLFIELIFVRNLTKVFDGKYAAALTTSINFYDHTANNYINAICDDLEMKFFGSFSADMHYMLKSKNRKQMLTFVTQFINAIECKSLTPKNYDTTKNNSLIYKQVRDISKKISLKKTKILLLKDSNKDGNINAMVSKFASCFNPNIEIFTLDSIRIDGGCLGCLKCGFDNICAYSGKDDFVDFFKSKVMTAQVIVMAGRIHDRYLSSIWKLYFDRSFFMTHIPTLANKQIGYLISGPLRENANLKQILEGYAECMDGNLIGFVTDEYSDSEKIDSLIENMANYAAKSLEEEYVKPRTFLAVGGKKIFRDNIWGRFRFIFQADDRFYKAHRMYDFPQYDIKMLARNIGMIILTKIPKFKKRLAEKMKQALVQPYKKYLR